MNYALGVDIGTTSTAAATWRDGRAGTVPLSDDGDAVPSAVLLLDDGSMLVGDAAVRRGVSEPDRLARGFKRGLADRTPMLLGDETVARTELTGQLLRFVLQKVSEREGGPPAQITLTIPASWGSHHQELMTRVAAEAGLAEVSLLAEPFAVAVHYAAQQGMRVGDLVAVYDLGGGTFDAAVVELTDGAYRLRGRPGGDESVGGEDFDRLVMAHVGRALGNTLAGVDRSDEDVAVALRRAERNAIAAKETLSADVDATIVVELPGLDPRRIRFTRAEFEAAIRIPLLRTVAALGATIDSSGVEPERLTAVLLAGGSSQIPLVSRLIGEEFGIAVVTDAHPKFAVCLGAAIAAGRRVQLADVVERSRRVPGVEGPAVAQRSGDPSNDRAEEAAVGHSIAGWDPTVDIGPADRMPAEVAALLAGPEAQVVADPVRIGLTRPPDIPIRAASGIRPTLRYLSDRDVVSVAYTGGGRKKLLPLLIGLAVVVVVGVLIVVLADRGRFGSSGSEAATDGSGAPSPTSTASAAESVSPAPEVEAPGVLATAMPVSGQVGEEMRGAAVLGDGYVAVGGVGGSTPTTTVWIGDGRGWTPSAGPAAAGRTTQLTAVAGGRQRLIVAVGWSAEPGAVDDPARRRGEIWVSSDGRRWVPATMAAEVGELTAVAALPDGGYLAAGQDFTREPADGDAIVLTSIDGAMWDVVPSSGLDGPGPMTLRALAVGAGGGLIAVGAELDGARTRTGLWRSPSGADWIFDQWLPGTDADGTGIGADSSGETVVVGAAAGQAVLWRGENGSLVEHVIDVGPGARTIGVVGGSAGPVVVGSSGESAPAAWTVGG